MTEFHSVVLFERPKMELDKSKLIKANGLLCKNHEKLSIPCMMTSQLALPIIHYRFFAHSCIIPGPLFTR